MKKQTNYPCSESDTIQPGLKTGEDPYGEIYIIDCKKNRITDHRSSTGLIYTS